MNKYNIEPTDNPQLYPMDSTLEHTINMLEKHNKEYHIMSKEALAKLSECYFDVYILVPENDDSNKKHNSSPIK